MESIGEIIRKAEDNFLTGTTQISKYVERSPHEVLEKVDAYYNSKHTSGEFDSLGREKPFFNIGIATANIWFRATDIDRSNIKVRATKAKQWIASFLATIHLQDWMRRKRFGSFLNEWGKTLAKYGSAVVKFVEGDELDISVVIWNTLIFDAVNFEQNPVIEVLELTEAELRRRVNDNGYDAEAVKGLIDAQTTRETLDKNRKDNKTGYYKVYEVHGELPLYNLTGNDNDKDDYVQQMHVISFIGKRVGRKTEYQDFTLYKGKEKKSPYMLTHLIKEDGQTLAIGSIERRFQDQWMYNHSMKAIKDTLDLASKNIFQTSDAKFLGRNVLTQIETGQILIHSPNQPITQINNVAHDVVSWQNFAVQSKAVGNEGAGISEAMLGVTPSSNTAWRQTEAILQETHSLFELMTENKGLYVEDMLRGRIIPSIKRNHLSNAEEIGATLKSYEIDKIDGLYIKNESIKKANKQFVQKVIDGKFDEISPETQMMMATQNEADIKNSLNVLGQQRFFKPDEVDWKTEFKDLEWDLEIDITGESKNVKDVMATLNTALTMVMNPNYGANKQAQAIVGRILENAGSMSPIEFNALPPPPVPAPVPSPINPNALSTVGAGGAVTK